MSTTSVAIGEMQKLDVPVTLVARERCLAAAGSGDRRSAATGGSRLPCHGRDDTWRDGQQRALAHDRAGRRRARG